MYHLKLSSFQSKVKYAFNIDTYHQNKDIGNCLGNIQAIFNNFHFIFKRKLMAFKIFALYITNIRNIETNILILQPNNN